MSGNGSVSLINLGELSKPATVLVEKISDAVGGLFKPYQIVRVAKAEAEAERIRAESQVQISDLQRRAFYRWLDEEAKKQRNIEEITRQALPQLSGKSEPEKLDNDWIVNFFEKCRIVSDTEMQQLWSRVLAGEANAPSSFSKRTVSFLSTLDKAEAQLFTRFCTFCWWISYLVPLVYDIRGAVYPKHSIAFGSLSHLESIGLIQMNPLTGYAQGKLPKTFTSFYYGSPVELELQKEGENELSVGHVVLTRTGKELAPICGSQPDPEFREYILSVWKSRGYIKESKSEEATEGGGA